MILNEDYLDNINKDDLEDSIEDYSMEEGYPCALLLGGWCDYDIRFTSIFSQSVQEAYNRFKKVCAKKLAGYSVTDEQVYTQSKEYVEYYPDYFELMDDDMNAEFGVAPNKYCCIIVYLAPMRRVTDLLNLIYYANKCLKKELEKPLFRLWDAKNKKTITGHWINMFTDKIIKEINAREFYEIIKEHQMIEGDISYEKFLTEVARFVNSHKELSAYSAIMDYLPKKKV